MRMLSRVLAAVSAGFAIVMANVSPAAAQDFIMSAPVAAQGSVQIIGGTPAAPRDWPATLVFTNSGGGGCTSTVVGRRVVLTAAHCVENGQSGVVRLRGADVAITCNHHPDYPGDISADFALCLAASNITGISYERISADLSLLQHPATIVLLGYGCRTPGGGDGAFGTLYRGDATIANGPERDLYTLTRGGAAVCFGDSGGAAYVDLGGGRRVIVGVNSRGDISRWSWLSSTPHSRFLRWALDWARDPNRNVQICGLHQTAPVAEGCRQ